MTRIARTIALLLLLCFALAQAQEPQESKTKDTPRATGIGGIFFKAKDPAALKGWYEKNLGMPMDQFGIMFRSLDVDPPHQEQQLQWAAFNEKTSYFDPSEKPFMINYRVNDLAALLEQLKAAGVEPVDTVETYSYGKFVHIMDIEGNKIELWEPPDSTVTFDSE